VDEILRLGVEMKVEREISAVQELETNPNQWVQDTLDEHYLPETIEAFREEVKRKVTEAILFGTPEREKGKFKVELSYPAPDLAPVRYVSTLCDPSIRDAFKKEIQKAEVDSERWDRCDNALYCIAYETAEKFIGENFKCWGGASIGDSFIGTCRMFDFLQNERKEIAANKMKTKMVVWQLLPIVPFVDLLTCITCSLERSQLLGSLFRV
jgi:hypothetical protein